ncbi:hypothetical protein MMC20_001888, partial [Loxospora ochrophaea]|nr:hypothetical protein [Loxospora ochrophaea]
PQRRRCVAEILSDAAVVVGGAKGWTQQEIDKEVQRRLHEDGSTGDADRAPGSFGDTLSTTEHGLGEERLLRRGRSAGRPGCV